MKFSVIISTYSLNRYDDLIELINNIQKQTYSDFETIIIIDENKQLLEKIKNYIQKNQLCKMKIIYNSDNKGLSHSRNIGIENSSGDILAFIDDDAIPDENWVKSLIEIFDSDDDIGAMTGHIIPEWEHKSMAWFPKELHWMISCSYTLTPTVKQEVNRGFGTNMAFRRDIIHKVGIFATNIGINKKKWIGGEDTDMFLRVKNAGMKVVFEPKVIVKHKIYNYRIKIRNIIKRAFNGGFSVAMMKKSFAYDLSNSIENTYLESLLLTFYPNKIKEFAKTPSSILPLKQMVVVFIVIIFEIIGFLYALFTVNTSNR